MAIKPKRFGVAVSVAALALVGLSACSNDSDSGSGSGLTKDKVTLTYAMWDQNQQPALKQAADEFTKEHPNVKIDLTVIPAADYWTKLQTQLTAGGGPDVFWMNGPNFQLYASNKQLAPLDKAVGDTSVYPKALTDLYSYDGKLYGAPKDFDTIGVYYNKALFDAAGLAYPKAGWTWEEFQADAKKLTDKAKGIWGTASAPYGQMTFYNTIFQAGGEVISSDGKTSGYDSPEALKGVTFWNDLIANGSSPSLKQITDTWPGDTFSSGKMGMFWDGSWAAIQYSKAEALKGHLGVAPLPKGPVSDVSVIHGLANVANAKSKNVAWAAKFAAFMGGKEVADIQAATGTVIPAYNGTQDKWVAAYPDLDAQLFLDEAKTAVPLPISKNTAAWGKFEGEQINKIYSGETTPEQGLKDLADQMNAALAKE